MYYDKDVDIDVLKDKKIAVIGYGSQGMAQSRNMADSGLNVVVGLREGGKSWQTAKNDGMIVLTVEEAAKQADIIHILIPDELQAKVYQESIKNGLSLHNRHCLIALSKFVTSIDRPVISLIFMLQAFLL